MAHKRHLSTAAGRNERKRSLLAMSVWLRPTPRNDFHILNAYWILLLFIRKINLVKIMFFVDGFSTKCHVYSGLLFMTVENIIENRKYTERTRKTHAAYRKEKQNNQNCIPDGGCLFCCYRSSIYSVNDQNTWQYRRTDML